VLAVSIALFNNELHPTPATCSPKASPRSRVSGRLARPLIAEQRIEWMDTLGRRRLRFLPGRPPAETNPLASAAALTDHCAAPCPIAAVRVGRASAHAGRFSPHPRVLPPYTRPVAR